MSIVIDAGTIPYVFSSTNARHSEFEPVLKWVLSGKGVMKYGGEKYNKELRKLSRYLGVIGELVNLRKAEVLDSAEVDSCEKQVKKRKEAQGCNDQHIIAIATIGKCKVICSVDKEAHPFFLSKPLYPKRFSRPKIYSGLPSISVLGR